MNSLKGLGIAVAACALTLAVAVPASAQTNDETAVAKRSRAQVAQSRTSITVFPRSGQRLHPNAKRHCEAWLREEHRPSGTVVTPQMRCWWQ
ncbi:MAG: hypothetical protein AB7O50_00330 [Pseudolabrys sp.]